MINIAIRADGGLNMGMGHIMRCISLAREFRASGCGVVFVSRVSQGIERIKQDGFEVCQLKGEDRLLRTGSFYGDTEWLDEEAKEIAGIIGQRSISLLLVDSYNVTEHFLLSLKGTVNRLAYIDDINAFVYPVDILINGNVTGSIFDYKKYSDEEVLLLGSEYNLIRDEFRGLPDVKPNPEVKEIMITTGGSDPYGITLKILKKLRESTYFSKIVLNAVIGGAFENKEILEQYAYAQAGINVYENTASMSEIMLRSDIAISSGGSTLYELCACGTPTLAFIMADNQKDIVCSLSNSGYIKSIGDRQQIDKEKWVSTLIAFCDDYSERQKMADKAKTLVDGFGTRRIVQKILDIMKL